LFHRETSRNFSKLLSFITLFQHRKLQWAHSMVQKTASEEKTHVFLLGIIKKIFFCRL